MEKRQLVYYIFCILILSEPLEQNVYTKVCQYITFLLSFLQFHFFRKFLASGPPASKTVIHGLLISFTYVIQTYITYMFLLTIFSCLTTLAEWLLHEYPNGFCQLVSPTSLGQAMILYLTYLAFFRLLMVTKINTFINLNHESMVVRLNVIAGLIMTVNIMVELLYRGTTCNPKVAALYSGIRMGIKLEAGNITLGEDTPDSYSSYITFIFSTLAVVFYVISAVIEIVNDDQSLLLLCVKQCRQNRVGCVDSSMQVDTQNRGVMPVIRTSDVQLFLRDGVRTSTDNATIQDMNRNNVSEHRCLESEKDKIISKRKVAPIHDSGPQVGNVTAANKCQPTMNPDQVESQLPETSHREACCVVTSAEQCKEIELPSNSQQAASTSCDSRECTHVSEEQAQTFGETNQTTNSPSFEPQQLLGNLAEVSACSPPSENVSLAAVLDVQSNQVTTSDQESQTPGPLTSREELQTPDSRDVVTGNLSYNTSIIRQIFQKISFSAVFVLFVAFLILAFFDGETMSSKLILVSCYRYAHLSCDDYISKFSQFGGYISKFGQISK